MTDNQAVFAASGEVRGWDVVSGRQLWAWQPVRWTANQQAPQSGSGNAWAPLAADPDNDLVFIPTGSSSVDFYGGQRVGDNRDADSIVALQASTGKRVWAFQLVHHDLWDYDTPSQPLLFTFRQHIPAVAITTKTSMVFVFNRLTGEPLFPIEERPVPPSSIKGEVAWPTQPFSTLPPLTPLQFSVSDLHLPTAAEQQSCEKQVKGLEYHGLFTPPSEKGTLVYPGNIGGANWGSSAFDPQTSTLYTRVSSVPFVVEVYARPSDGHWYSQKLNSFRRRFVPLWMGGLPQRLDAQYGTPDGGGSTRDENPMEGTPYVLSREGLVTTSGTPCGPKPYGSIVALNLDSGKKLWTASNGEMDANGSGSPGVGGVIATGGGLIFGASSNDGLIHAYDSATGRMLWRAPLPAPANATPMTYTAGGRQFVVIEAGGHGFLGGAKSDAVVAFALPLPATAPVTKGKAKRKTGSGL